MQKLPLFIAVFLFFLNCVYSQKQTENSVTLSVSSMKGLPRPKTVSRGQSFDPDIKLVILNNTDTVTSFYKTWNLWGDGAIRLELTIKDSVFILYYSSFCSSNNFPDAEKVPPGDSMVIYLKIERCYERGPCPCLYSLPKGYSIPMSHLRGAQLRAFYKVNFENHQQEIARSMEEAKWLDSINHKKNKITKDREKYLRSFVTSELVSKTIILDYDSW